MEVRRKDGHPYPPNGLFQLVSGLQRFLREARGVNDIAFFNKSSSFGRLRKASVIRVVLPDNIDTVVICKNGREIKVTMD